MSIESVAPPAGKPKWLRVKLPTGKNIPNYAD